MKPTVEYRITLKKNLSKCNFVQQKSRMDSFEIETKHPQWGADEKTARDMTRPSKTKIHLTLNITRGVL